MIDQLAGAAARVLAGHALELLGRHRRARLPGRGDLGPALRRFLRGADLRAARHGRHRLHRVRTPTPSASPPATIAARDKSLALLDDPQSSAYAQAPHVLLGRRRAGVDGVRLPALLPDAARRRRARRRCASSGRKTLELMTTEPPARRPGPRRARDRRLQRDDLRRHRLRPRLLGGARPGRARTPPARSASSAGAAWRQTVFWVDPAEELVVIFMTQFMPSGTFNFRGQLRSIVYGAIVD